MPHESFEHGDLKKTSSDNESGQLDATSPLRSWKQILRIMRIPVIIVLCGYFLNLDYNSIQQVSRLARAKRPAASTTERKMLPELPVADMHAPQSEVLGLLDWEINSLKGITEDTDWPNDHIRNQKVAASCNPPNGISQSCCIGSFSQGGEVNAAFRHMCQVPMQSQLPEMEQTVRDFFGQNPLSGGDNVTSCDVCRIVELARRHNWTIVFMGDSMHSQVIEGLDCELERRNYLVETEWQQHETTPHGSYQQKHARSKIMRVRSPLWPVNATVSIKYHMIYKVPVCTGCGNFSALTREADVLVMGFGLHWWYSHPKPDSGEDEYTSHMAQTFAEIRNQGRVKLLIHRETSAQHFDADGGEYSFWKNIPNRTMECRPFRPEDESVYWREKLISRAAQLAGLHLIQQGPAMPMMPPSPHSSGNNLTEVVSLPYFHFTAQFSNMHPISYKPGHTEIDCTHYCGSPFLYYPLWRSLRLAMDRRFEMA